ncbi:sn-glycerol-3-phosphate ABC transporter ATP-binding protein UgpC [uncultured Kiloniella sp.]|uniref:sn-glycerol-3-phosphate ABC transporter ATP-binding protein UgpC n=1 Tax=uncultured Kiloniella sp. TaxID=1133091 RepID=UPI0026035E7A|nr:sn-glycerol-3-phosphate ABC transporter ATP-binding protein UgpC [uncultured Kiloniella sp.]
MAEVKLTNVNKVYPNGAHAVRGVNMEIADGEFIVFVGPSGCGKSTLLRMVAGLETVTEGDLHIDENRINDVSPAERNVAMVFQNYALYPHMTVRGNMSYGLKNRGDSKEEIEQKVIEAAKTLHIEDFLDRQPNQLSGGQRQRVAMGRAIVRNPKVFLFDEPLSNLDAKLRVQMRIEIKKLQRKMGVTSIYVTHDQTEAMTLADRLAVINNGQIEQMGKPIELYKDPKTLFVASFIGSPQINLMSAQYDGKILKSGTLEIDGFENLPVAEELVLGLRPEHLRIDTKGKLAMNIDLVEQHGADNLVYGTLEGAKNEDGEDLELCLRLNQDQEPSIGETITLSYDHTNALVFSKETGKRLI